MKFALIVALPVALACWIGGARAQGDLPSELAAARSYIHDLRGVYNQAAARRCRDGIEHYAYPYRRVPAARVLPIIRTWENRIRRLRADSRPRADCWQSHLWAESSAGRCVSSKEGSLRSVSRPSGTYHGKWQMNAGFERAHGPRFVARWGRASNWPEHAQDLAAWRGFQASGWHPWPTTARRCGLL